VELLEIQKRMFEAVAQPLTASEHMQQRNAAGRSMHEVAAEFIKPNDRLNSFERLEIYNRQYWFRVLGALDEDFPGLRAIVGQRRFEELCKAYLMDCPSNSFTLRNLGSRLESWLRSHLEWVHPRTALALDMVRLEWAEIEAFDGAMEPALRAQDLPIADPDPRFRLQPYLQLLRLRYPVDDLLVAVRNDGSDSDVASNAISERRRRTRGIKIARQKTQNIFLAVHRIDFSVYFKRLEPEAFAFLMALREEKRLSEAARHAFEASGVPESRIVGTVQGWFENWSALGWFCRPESANPGQNSLNHQERAS
jgi:hypothetical protein